MSARVLTGTEPVWRGEAELARHALLALYGHLREQGCAAPDGAAGQLIRPVLALAGSSAHGQPRDERFWAGVAAVQLAHEASLVHDDVIDAAATRRSEPTLAASRGVAAALVEGDHLLTTAYRLAAATSSPAFMSAFALAVERTVAGEKLQGRSAGMVLDEQAYRRIVGMKSGELLGCALATAPLLAGDPRAGDWYVLGRRVGTLYQMLDDLLDYCPAAAMGKPALGDFAQRRWTWPLLELGEVDFDAPVDVVTHRFASPDEAGRAPLERCRDRLRSEAMSVLAAASAFLPGDNTVRSLVDGWMERVDDVVARTLRTHADTLLRASLDARVAQAADRTAFFQQNSRSFSFAARLFPPAFRERVGGVYAFCRITDDLADADDGLDEARRMARLDLWERLARQAHGGSPVGIPLLDDVMAEAAAAGVPFGCIEALVEGMRMDLRGAHYETLEELRVYSYRVAGVVGQWLTRMCGVHDDATLARAADLGHAMQLTNILRDVGEDLRRGRVYIPARTLADAGITPADLQRMAEGGVQPEQYPRMIEELMQVADRDYHSALAAVGALPRAFRAAVVVAAHVYRGIHDGIRANGYDNVNRRARTSAAAKLVHATRALGALPLQRFSRSGGLNDQHSAIHDGRGPRRRGVSTALLLAVAAGLAGSARVAPAHAQSRDTGESATVVSPAAHARELEAAHSAHPDRPDIALDLVRSLFFVGVDSAAAVDRARATLHEIGEADARFADEHHAVLLAYDGALSMLDAKHGSWPHARLRAMRQGLSRLDDAVDAAPDNSEVRYLRLVSTHYMPGIFGRRDSAREDLRVLATLLPDPALPPALHAVVAEFVRQHGN